MGQIFLTHVYLPEIQKGCEKMWKPVKGYEGLYEVSDEGAVKSLPKKAGRRNQPEKLSATFINRIGYVCVNLYKDNHQKQVRVHRLVAEAFIPNPENLPCVNHIDGNKLNNHVYNLEWCTQSENAKHAFQTGLRTGMQGESHPMYGKKHSKETLEKLSEASKQMWKRRKGIVQ